MQTFALLRQIWSQAVIVRQQFHLRLPLPPAQASPMQENNRGRCGLATLIHKQHRAPSLLFNNTQQMRRDPINRVRARFTAFPSFIAPSQNQHAPHYTSTISECLSMSARSRLRCSSVLLVVWQYALRAYCHTTNKTPCAASPHDLHHEKAIGRMPGEADTL